MEKDEKREPGSVAGFFQFVGFVLMVVGGVALFGWAMTVLAAGAGIICAAVVSEVAAAKGGG